MQLQTDDGVPAFQVEPDPTKKVLSVDIFYTQHGLADEKPTDMLRTKHRFWHYADADESNGRWSAKLPIATTSNSLWVYANVMYSLETPVTGAGYYYRTYTANSFNVSSSLHMVTTDELVAAKTKETLASPSLIETTVVSSGCVNHDHS